MTLSQRVCELGNNGEALLEGLALAGLNLS